MFSRLVSNTTKNVLKYNKFNISKFNYCKPTNFKPTNFNPTDHKLTDNKSTDHKSDNSKSSDYKSNNYKKYVYGTLFLGGFATLYCYCNQYKNNITKLVDVENTKLIKYYPNVTHLTFGDKFNQPLKKGDIPQSITHLTFGDGFDQPLNKIVIPPNVTYLILNKMKLQYRRICNGQE